MLWCLWIGGCLLLHLALFEKLYLGDTFLALLGLKVLGPPGDTWAQQCWGERKECGGGTLGPEKASYSPFEYLPCTVNSDSFFKSLLWCYYSASLYPASNSFSWTLKVSHSMRLSFLLLFPGSKLRWSTRKPMMPSRPKFSCFWLLSLEEKDFWY